jgi:hypothetical protein
MNVSTKVSTALFLMGALAGGLFGPRAGGQTAAAPAKTTKETIAWGKPYRGLESGLSFADGSSRFKVGATVRLNFYWRNVSRQAVTLSYAFFPDFGFYPTVLSSDGHRQPLLAEVTLALEERRTVQPGETICVGHPVLVITSNAAEAGILPSFGLTAGRYTVKVGGNEQRSPVPVSGSLNFQVEATR